MGIWRRKYGKLREGSVGLVETSVGGWAGGICQPPAPVRAESPAKVSLSIWGREGYFLLTLSPWGGKERGGVEEAH